MGIGSTKPVTFPWGVSWSAFTFLNQYLSISGMAATNKQLIRESTDTNTTYPYPSIPFGTVTPTSTSRRASLVNTDPRIGVKFSESGIERFTNRPYLIPERNDEIGTTVSIDFTM
jgi:hypothetical protein